MKNIFLAGLFAFMLSGCISTELSTQGKSYDATKDARIRLYGQNRRPSTMEVKINGKVEKITVGGGFGQALSSTVGLKENESIGMPETELSKDPTVLSKLLSSIFFKEFVIPAGEVKVNNSLMAMSTTSTEYTATHKITTTVTSQGCSGNEVVFLAEAGKDYEVAPISSSRQCGVTVYEIKSPTN